MATRMEPPNALAAATLEEERTVRETPEVLNASESKQRQSTSSNCPRKSLQ